MESPGEAANQVCGWSDPAQGKIASDVYIMGVLLQVGSLPTLLINRSLLVSTANERLDKHSRISIPRIISVDLVVGRYMLSCRESQTDSIMANDMCQSSANEACALLN